MRILLVEDSPALAKAIGIALKKQGYAIDHASEGNDGLYLAQNNDYDAAVLDIMVPGMSGLEILAHGKGHHRRPRTRSQRRR